jgi:hypothetical protein
MGYCVEQERHHRVILAALPRDAGRASGGPASAQQPDAAGGGAILPGPWRAPTSERRRSGPRIGPVLGVPASEVPDPWRFLLFGPVARDTVGTPPDPARTVARRSRAWHPPAASGGTTSDACPRSTARDRQGSRTRARPHVRARQCAAPARRGGAQPRPRRRHAPDARHAPAVDAGGGAAAPRRRHPAGPAGLPRAAQLLRGPAKGGIRFHPPPTSTRSGRWRCG